MVKSFFQFSPDFLPPSPNKITWTNKTLFKSRDFVFTLYYVQPRRRMAYVDDTKQMDRKTDVRKN